MDSVSFGFFTPIDYGDQPKTFGQSILETVDHYFYWGGRKAQVIPGMQNGRQLVEMVDGSQSLFKTCLKVASIFTLVLPALLLTVKVILRALNTYEVAGKKAAEETSQEENSNTSSTSLTSTENKEEPKSKSSGPQPPTGPAQALSLDPVEIRSGLETFIKSIAEHETALSNDKVKIPEYYPALKKNLDKAVAKMDQLVNPLQDPSNEANLENWATITSVAIAAYTALIYQRDELRKVINTPQFWVKTDQVYNSLTTAYFNQGNLEKSLKCAVCMVDQAKDSFIQKIAEEYYKQGKIEIAVISLGTQFGKEGTELLAKITSDYIQAGELSNALAILQSNFYSSTQLKEIRELVQKDKRSLQWKDREAIAIEIQWMNCTSEIRNILFQLLAEDYYSNGKLVKALLTIAKIDDYNLATEMLNTIYNEKKPLARNENGDLIIGDCDQALETIKTLTDVFLPNEMERWTCLSTIRDYFYLLLAEDSYQNRLFVRALTTLAKVKRAGVIYPFMKRVVDEKKLFSRDAQGRHLIGDRDEAEKSLKKQNTLQVTGISEVFYHLLAEDYYSEGNTFKALVAISTGRYDNEDLFNNFLNKVLEENKPLDIQGDSKAILKEVAKLQPDVANVFYALVAESQLRANNVEVAKKFANVIKENDELKDRLLAKIESHKVT